MAGKSKSKVSAGIAAQTYTPPINNINSSMKSGHSGVISGSMVMNNSICHFGVTESTLCQGQIYPPQVQNPSYGQVYSSTTFQNIRYFAQNEHIPSQGQGYYLQQQQRQQTNIHT